MNYGKRISLPTSFEETVTRVREALGRQGFGVLTEIDITATMQEKLGVTVEEFVILGACNPPLAHRALEIDRSIGLLLPCNVAIRAKDDSTLVEVLDPQVMVEVTGLPELKAVADDAASRLDKVLAELAG